MPSLIRFDLVFCMLPTTSRHSPAASVPSKVKKKRNVFGKYGDTARRVIDALLTKLRRRRHPHTGERRSAARAAASIMGTPMELIQSFGGRGGYDSALQLIGAAVRHALPTSPVRLARLSHKPDPPPHSGRP